MDSNTNTTKTPAEIVTDAEFITALTHLKDEWDRHMNMMMRIGFTREEAAKAVGAAMTEWFNARRAK